MSVELYCLHGFLGEAADWGRVFAGDGWRATIHSVDWLAAFGTTSASWNDLAGRVNDWARGQTRHTDDGDVERVLVGYSLGGRVAMHAIVADPSVWAAAVIISANPGLSSKSERESRLAQDRAWAERFRREPWDQVIEAWNAQPVFAGEAEPVHRAESAAAREAAAAGLERWSVAAQDDLRQALTSLERPVLWIAGERDRKYVALMRECAALNARFVYNEVPAAGHRAPWTQAAYFQKVVRDWIETVPPIASHEHKDAQPT